MNITSRLLMPAFVLLACAGASAGDDSAVVARTASPAGARVYIVSPQDGAKVHSPVHVVFGLSGMGVAPAGVDSPHTGHHHLLVDVPLPALDQPIPKDAQHLHFGGGQTETELTLAPGQHTLQLLLADQTHVPHDPPIFSAPIKITVVE
jgi:Domain of unknown function (DUF4399)